MDYKTLCANMHPIAGGADMPPCDQELLVRCKILGDDGDEDGRPFYTTGYYRPDQGNNRGRWSIKRYDAVSVPLVITHWGYYSEILELVEVPAPEPDSAPRFTSAEDDLKRALDAVARKYKGSLAAFFEDVAKDLRGN